MRRHLILAVIAAAALIWSQSPVLAQPVATGLTSLPAATAIHDTDTLPLCQNGAPSCSLSSFLWSNANLGQIAANFAQRTQTLTNQTLSCSANVCTNIPSSALVATGVAAGTYTNANLTVNSAGQITAASSGSLTTAAKTANYTIVVPNDNGACFSNAGATSEVDFTLPTLAPGLNFCFTVMAAQVLKVIAPGGSGGGIHIAIAPNNSGAGGHIDDSTLYETITLYVPAGSTTQWVTASVVGSNWQIDN